MTNAIKKMEIAEIAAQTTAERERHFEVSGLETASAAFFENADAVLSNMVNAYFVDVDTHAKGFARFITSLNAAKSKRTKAKSEYNKGASGKNKRGATTSEQAFATIVKRFNDYMHWGMGAHVKSGVILGGDKGPTHVRFHGYSAFDELENNAENITRIKDGASVELNVPTLDIVGLMSKGTVLDAGYAKPKLSPVESKLVALYGQVTKPIDKQDSVAINEAFHKYNEAVIKARTGTATKDSSVVMDDSFTAALKAAMVKINGGTDVALDEEHDEERNAA